MTTSNGKRHVGVFIHFVAENRLTVEMDQVRYRLWRERSKHLEHLIRSGPQEFHVEPIRGLFVDTQLDRDLRAAEH